MARRSLTTNEKAQAERLKRLKQFLQKGSVREFPELRTPGLYFCMVAVFAELGVMLPGARAGTSRGTTDSGSCKCPCVSNVESSASSAA